MPDEQSGKILWYNPDPRAIIPLESFHTSHSLRKILKKNIFSISINQRFADVLELCADRPETWINDEIKQSYFELHVFGLAHSVEVLLDGKLVGGVYGVAINAAFYAESMFSKVSNASKVALYYLVERLNTQNFQLLEVQFLTPHLQSLGAEAISRDLYLEKLRRALKKKTNFVNS